MVGMRYFGVACAVCAAIVLGLAGSAEAKELSVVKPEQECAGLAETDVVQDGEAPARIITARVVQGSISPYCEVRGYVAPQVKFELRLPTQNWTQRMMYNGCGGFCGRIDFRIRAAEGCAAIDNGEMALVSSDLGHDAPDGNANTVWASNNPQGRLDYGHRGVHVVTVAAKAIIARFYGRPASFAYFNGCSDGGREGMMEVQRYPDDYDGVIAGAPVINATANNTIFHAWSAQHLSKSDGSLMFAAADLVLLHKAALQACDLSGDGVADGVVGDPLACHFDPVAAQCQDGEALNCLTAEQIAAARALYSGPMSADGLPLYYGRPIGSELAWGGPEVAIYARSFVRFMTTAQPQRFDLTAFRYDPASLAVYNAQARVFNALDPHINAFQQSGGKLILWHGLGDWGVPPASTAAYYAQVRQSLVGAEQFVRLYMLPGVGHCGGGEGPDKINLLDVMMAWVEDGIAPSAIQSSRKAFGRTLQTRPIYPWPNTALYDGVGPVSEAASFRSSEH